MIVGLMLLVVIVWLLWRRLQVSEPTPSSGREQYEPDSGVRNRLNDRFADSDILVDRVEKRAPDAPRKPSLVTGVSCIVLGQTGVGKSTFVKQYYDQLVESDDTQNAAIIAHALSDPGRSNEYADFFEHRGLEVIKISSQNSTHRWDPLFEYGGSLRDLSTLSTGMFAMRNTKETGWMEPAKSLLTCALLVTRFEAADFAGLPDVLQRGPPQIVREARRLPVERTAMLTAPVETLDGDEESATYSTLLNQIQPLLLSDLYDESLPRLSLRDFQTAPGDRALVLDHIGKDRFARGFWRFFIESTIDIAFAAQERQRFLLDEFDKLPRIANLPRLVSAGRSAEVAGVLVAQDVNQIEYRYGDLTQSLWTNCPNRVAFRAGDTTTAETILSGLGTVELQTQAVTNGGDEEISPQTSQRIVDKQPLLTGDLMSLSVGEALVQSRDGWWLTKLTEPDYPVVSEMPVRYDGHWTPPECE